MDDKETRKTKNETEKIGMTRTATVKPASHSLALAISLPTTSLVILCLILCVCYCHRRRKARARLLSRLSEQADSAKTAVKKLAKRADKVGRRLVKPAALAPTPMQMLVTVLQQLPAEQSGQKTQERRRRPAYMYRRDEEQTSMPGASELLPHTDRWVARAAAMETVEGADAGLGQIQLGIRYDRRHRLLTVALLRATGLQQPPLDDDKTQRPMVQAVLQIFPAHGVSGSSGGDSNNNSYSTPPAEFNAGQPNWRYAFRFEDFPDPLSRWSIRVSVRPTVGQQQFGEAWLDLARFSPQSPESSSSLNNSSSSTSSAAAAADNRDDNDENIVGRQRRRRQDQQQQDDEQAAEPAVELVLWQHLEQGWSCCSGY